MIKKFICLLSAITALNAAVIFAQEGPARMGEGTLMLSKKTFTLKNAIAYESATDDEGDVAIVLTAQPVSGAQLKKALDAEKDGGFSQFPKPFLKLVFKKTGELKYWSAAGGNTSIGGSGEGTGKFKLQDGYFMGKASAAIDSSGMIPKGFDVRFNVAPIKPGEELAASLGKKYGPAANVKPTVTGMFKGNGKNAKLGYVSARWGEPFDDKPGIVLVFTEKDHSKDAKPDFNASFGKFGSALIISLHEDGDIYGCEVVHSALEKKNFSSIGSIQTSGFNYENGKVEGELTTNGPVETFGEKWEVQLKFVAPLGEIPKELQSAKSNNAEQAEKQPTSESDEEIPAIAGLGEDHDESGTTPAAGGLKAQDLALTKDATEVNYQSLVEQINFKSTTDVRKTCAELAANLAAQGWAKQGADMVQPQSSILRRKRGDASLTIFVKPSSGGSEVKMMTEGLSWEGQ